MICEVCALERQQGGGILQGQTPLFQCSRKASNLFWSPTAGPHTLFSLSHLDMCFKCQFLINIHEVFAFGSYNIYGQKSTSFPGFQAKPSPIGATSNTWVPAHFELI